MSSFLQEQSDQLTGGPDDSPDTSSGFEQSPDTQTANDTLQDSTADAASESKEKELNFEDFAEIELEMTNILLNASDEVMRIFEEKFDLPLDHLTNQSYVNALSAMIQSTFTQKKDLALAELKAAAFADRRAIYERYRDVTIANVQNSFIDNIIRNSVLSGAKDVESIIKANESIYRLASAMQSGDEELVSALTWACQWRDPESEEKEEDMINILADRYYKGAEAIVLDVVPIMTPENAELLKAKIAEIKGEQAAEDFQKALDRDREADKRFFQRMATHVQRVGKEALESWRKVTGKNAIIGGASVWGAGVAAMNAVMNTVAAFKYSDSIPSAIINSVVATGKSKWFWLGLATNMGINEYTKTKELDPETDLKPIQANLIRETSEELPQSFDHTMADALGNAFGEGAISAVNPEKSFEKWLDKKQSEASTQSEKDKYANLKQQAARLQRGLPHKVSIFRLAEACASLNISGSGEKSANNYRLAIRYGYDLDQAKLIA